MPRYHRTENLGRLMAAGAGELTTVPNSGPLAEASSRQVQEGVQYLGRAEGGMSCVTCHRYSTFDPKSATPAPDLSTVAERLRPAWFGRWLRDPLRITPGTQMPAFFAGVDEEFSASHIDALWAALSLGKKMPVPDGVDLSGARLAYPLGDKPVVVRTFLEGSGPRSLAVGFKGAAYAFDAETCRLMYTWTGDFLDMSPAWVGRGGDMVKPLGTIGYRAGQLALISLPNSPDAKPVFKGYSTGTDGPQLEYQLGNVFIEDRLTPTAQGFARTLRMHVANGPTMVALTLDPQVTLVSPNVSTRQWLVASKGYLTLRPWFAPLQPSFLKKTVTALAEEFQPGRWRANFR